MMSRAGNRTLMAGMLSVIALVAAGCGGEEAAAPVDPAATPTPATTPGVATVADPNAAGATPAIDPVTGQPIAGAETGGATASIPNLSGDDIGGGLAAISGSSMFIPQAGAPEKKLDPISGIKPNLSTAAPVPAQPVVPTPAATYTAAKIYVDGMVHTVSRSGTFPKGNPVFRLLSISASNIEIELIAGEFTTSGANGTVIEKGKLLSLVNASEQLTYRVKYLSPISGAAGITF